MFGFCIKKKKKNHTLGSALWSAACEHVSLVINHIVQQCENGFMNIHSSTRSDYSLRIHTLLIEGLCCTETKLYLKNLVFLDISKEIRRVKKKNYD